MRIADAALVTVFVLCTCWGADAKPAGEPLSSEAAQDWLNWTMADGRVTHEASGTNCLDDVAGFAPLMFSGPSGTNILGTCHYVDVTGTGDAGIEVRRYARGEGESQEAIANDRNLMEPGPGGAPLFAVRMTAATTGDGTMGGRVTITKAVKGYLVDCFAEGATLEAASAKLASVCGK